MKRIITIIAVLCIIAPAFAAEPKGYYDTALNKSGYELKTALHNIISGHKKLSYGSGNEQGDNVWWRYRTTDMNPDGTVRDIYTTPGTYHFGYYSDSNYGYQCGSMGNNEGGVCMTARTCNYCYSREHSLPKSWWGGDEDTMYTDIHHLIPADQYINATYHNNYPLGETSSAQITSLLGYKRGPNKLVGYSGTIFEPADEYKGYFARIYFYMATRYENRIAGWSTNNDAKPMLNGTSDQCFTDWAKNMLVRWHNEHPIQDWERARNDSVYKVQHNRNPFIDHPELVNKIWGSDNTPFGNSNEGYSIKYILEKDGKIIDERIIPLSKPKE